MASASNHGSSPLVCTAQAANTIAVRSALSRLGMGSSSSSNEATSKSPASRGSNGAKSRPASSTSDGGSMPAAISSAAMSGNQRPSSRRTRHAPATRSRIDRRVSSLDTSASMCLILMRQRCGSRAEIGRCRRVSPPRARRLGGWLPTSVGRTVGQQPGTPLRPASHGTALRQSTFLAWPS